MVWFLHSIAELSPFLFFYWFCRLALQGILSIYNGGKALRLIVHEFITRARRRRRLKVVAPLPDSRSNSHGAGRSESGLVGRAVFSCELVHCVCKGQPSSAGRDKAPVGLPPPTFIYYIEQRRPLRYLLVDAVR